MTKGNFICALMCTGLLGIGKFILALFNLKIGNVKQAKLDLVSVILAALSWLFIGMKYYGVI